MANITKSNQLHNFSVQENLSACFMVEHEISNSVVDEGGVFTTGTYGIPRGVIVTAEITGSADMTITFGDDSTVVLVNAVAKNIFLKGAILPLAIKSWLFDATEEGLSLLAMF